jgi:hypothetical protein
MYLDWRSNNLGLKDIKGCCNIKSGSRVFGSSMGNRIRTLVTEGLNNIVSIILTPQERLES